MFNKRLFQFARHAPGALLATIAAGLGGSLLILGQARLLSQLINRAFLGGEALEALLGGLVGLLGLIALRSAFAWAAELSADRLAQSVKTDLRDLLLEKLLALGPAYMRGERAGELVNTTNEGIEALDKYFREYLPQVFLAGLAPLAFLVVVFPLDWLSGLTLLLTAPLIPFFMILIGRLADSLTKRQWQTLSRMSAHFLDVLQGLTTLKALGRSQAQSQGISEASERFRQITMQVLRVAFLSALVLELLSTLSTAVIAVGIGLRLLYGQLTFETALFILLLAPDFYLPLRLLGTRFHAGVAGVAAAGRIFEILDIPLPEADRVNAAPGPAAGHILAWSAPQIRFERVSFTYPGDAEPVLKEVSFTLPAGQRTALVGPSGAGKSTLVALLLGLYRPQTGRILVDGIPLDELNLAEWHLRVGWVSQTPYIFNDSLAANIGLAAVQADPAALESAARQAHLAEFIAGLPAGYQTPAGERGARLSGGQAQRLALARAFFKDAPVVVLDEATSHLDPRLEAELESTSTALIQGRTALIIAHRFATVQNADHIVVLQGGQVVEQGSRAELLAQRGLFWRLLQAHLDRLDDTGNAAEPLAQPRSLGETGQALRTSLPPAPENPAAAAADIASAAHPSPAAGAALSSGRMIWRLVGFLRPAAGWVALSILLGFLTIGSAIGLLTTSAYVISMAALQPSIAVLNVPIVGVRFFGIARGVFRYLERLVSHQVTFKVLAGLRTWFYEQIEPLTPARLLQFRSGDLLNRITADIEILQNFYLRVVAPPVVALLIAGVMALFTGAFHASLALVLLVFMALAGLAVPWLMRQWSASAGQALIAARGALSAGLVDLIQGLPELLLNNAERRHLATVRGQAGRYQTAQTRLAQLGGIQAALETWLHQGAIWLTLLAAIPLVQAGQFDGVYLAVIVLAVLSSFEAVQPLPGAAAQLESNLQAAGRLFELVNAHPEVVDEPDALVPVPAAAPVFATPGGFSLTARRLTFRYPGSQPPALLNVDFDLPPGKRMALVGASGSGKSTLVNLLLRFYAVQSGDLLLNGLPLRRYTQNGLRKALAVTPQQPHFFNASLRDNLLIANPKASQEQIEQACRVAQIHEFIETLPQGYATLLGDAGTRLSGGERQRLGLARAFLKDSPLLILDEPSANLDALTEQALLAAIYTYTSRRSLLLITHRLTGLEALDEILVLDGGQVVEAGSQSLLLRMHGYYRRMWREQNQLLEPD